MNYKQFSVPILGMCVFLSEASQSMYGDIEIYDAVIQNELKIIGRGSAARSTFGSTLRVMGFLQAIDCHFSRDVHVTGSNVVLKNNQILGDVHITNYVQRPKISLENSTVNGRIVFHSLKKGVVEKDKNSTIKYGIENGEE